MDDLNSPADYQWRCPCIGMPCDAARWDTIQDLIRHMEHEHGLAIVLVPSPPDKLGCRSPAVPQYRAGDHRD